MPAFPETDDHAHAVDSCAIALATQQTDSSERAKHTTFAAVQHVQLCAG